MSDIDGTEQQIDELQDPKADDLDRAVEAGAMELLVALGDTERRELQEVTLALEKLESGSYGHCEACVETQLKLCATVLLYPRPVLKLPTARLCVACQEPKSSITIIYASCPRRWFGEDEGEFSHPLMNQDDDN